MITYLIYMNEELKHFFTPGPMVSFKRSRKISSYLVRAKFYPVERSVGYFNCKRPHCQFCAYIMRRKPLPVRVQEKLTKLIIDFTPWRNA